MAQCASRWRQIFFGGLVACNDDAQGCPGFTSRISVFVTAGDYLIRVGGYQAQQGTGTLTVDLEPEHDQCVDAQNVFVDGERSFCTGGADTDVWLMPIEGGDPMALRKERTHPDRGADDVVRRVAEMLEGTISDVLADTQI